jgi:hypothetical protein
MSSEMAFLELNEDSVFIYGLKDPRDNLIKYIGKTINPVLRLASHVHDFNLTGYNSPKQEWILKLNRLGLKPVMVILKIVPAAREQIEEYNMIQHYIEIGFELFNTKHNTKLVKDNGNYKKLCQAEKEENIISVVKLFMEENFDISGDPEDHEVNFLTPHVLFFYERFVKWVDNKESIKKNIYSSDFDRALTKLGIAKRYKVISVIPGYKVKESLLTDHEKQSLEKLKTKRTKFKKNPTLYTWQWERMTGLKERV